MVDWNIVAKVAGGGFGMTIFVLMVLSLASWIVGLIVQKTHAGSKETPEKKEA